VIFAYSFDWRVVTDRWQLFAAGAWVDVWVTSLGFAFACLLGVVIGVLRTSGTRITTFPAFLYVQLVRGVPLYVVLLWVYYGLATVSGIAFTAVQAIVVTLALTGSGYTAEIFRAGIEAVDRGQVEAAQSLGLSRIRLYWNVLLPQAVRIVVAPLGNVFIALLKGATIVSVIAVPDMVFQAQEINVRYFVPFEAFTAVAVILVALVITFSGLVYMVERALRLP
jgi:His/Glu/Gln/Arg/opine family amino acid ABC transporter permease subunit